MSGHPVLLALGIVAATTGIARGQSNSSVAGWWYAADNQWQLRVVELQSDGTATLGTCIRAHPYDQACAGSAKVVSTATYALRGNEIMWTMHEDGMQIANTFAVSRPDPRSSMRKLQLNNGPNHVFYYFEMPQPRGGWASD